MPKNTTAAGKTPLSTIGQVLGRSFSNLGLGTKLKEFNVKKRWPDIAGPVISKKTEPLRLINKTLHVAVSTSAWMAELRFHKDELIEKINSLVGGDAVEDVVFKLGKVSSPPEPVVEKTKRPLTEKEKRFIAGITSSIKDAPLKSLIKRVMEKGKTTR